MIIRRDMSTRERLSIAAQNALYRPIETAVAVGMSVALVAGVMNVPEDEGTPNPDIAMLCEGNTMEAGQVTVELPSIDIADGHGPESDVEHETVVSKRFFSLTHTVAEGERLENIADCYFARTDLETGFHSLMAANPGLRPEDLSAGQQIQINISDAEIFRLPDRSSIADIAENLGVDVGLMQALNDVDGDHIFEIGEPIITPQQAAVLTDDLTQTHIVQSGDTFTGIAERTGNDLEEILSLNSHLSPELLQPGYIIYTPSRRDQTEATDQEIVPANERLLAFVETFGPIAVPIAEEYGVPYQVMLAQAIHETGYASSELSLNANNFFGIKASAGGGGWEGEVYPNVTEEVYAAADAQALIDSGEAELIEDLGDGNWRVEVTREFRQYPSARDSFVDYAAYLRDSGYYDDAFEADSPTAFLASLVDDNGPGYATNPDYLESLRPLILNIPVLDDEGRIPMEVPPVPPADPEVSGSFEDRVAAMQLTPYTYDTLVSSINRDYIDVAYNGGDNAYNPDRISVEQADTQWVTLHFTTVYYNADGSDASQESGDFSPDRFITSTGINRDGDNCCGVYAVTDRDGRVFQMVRDGGKTMHDPPYDSISDGIEIEATANDRISPTQLQNAVLFALYRLKDVGLLGNQPLDQILRGHGENRSEYIEQNPGTDLDVRTDFTREEMQVIRSAVEQSGIIDYILAN